MFSIHLSRDLLFFSAFSILLTIYLNHGISSYSLLLYFSCVACFCSVSSKYMSFTVVFVSLNHQCADNNYNKALHCLFTTSTTCLFVLCLQHTLQGSTVICSVMKHILYNYSSASIGHVLIHVYCILLLFIISHIQPMFMQMLTYLFCIPRLFIKNQH